MKRDNISSKQITQGITDIKEAMEVRLKKHGYGSFTSNHEALGIIQEEMHELVEAIRDDGKLTKEVILKGNKFVIPDIYEDCVASELMDVAVAALFGYICRKR